MTVKAAPFLWEMPQLPPAVSLKAVLAEFSQPHHFNLRLIVAKTN